MVWSTNADDVKMLLDIPFSMNYVTIDQLALHLVDIFLLLCKSLLCFEKIEKLDTTKIWLVKFCMFNFKIAYFTQLLTDFSNLDLNTNLRYVLSKIKKVLKIKQKTFVLLLIKC